MNTQANEIIKLVGKSRRDPATSTALLGLGIYAMGDSDEHLYVWKVVYEYITELEKENSILRELKDK